MLPYFKRKKKEPAAAAAPPAAAAAPPAAAAAPPANKSRGRASYGSFNDKAKAEQRATERNGIVKEYKTKKGKQMYIVVQNK